MVIRINSNIAGFSGTSWNMLERYAIMLNKGITPCVAEKGSLSASGDLCQLAAIAAAAIGLDGSNVIYEDKIVSSSLALSAFGLETIKLLPKEGLSLVNGTSVSAALTIEILYDIKWVISLVHVLTALSVEALIGSKQNFDPEISFVRPHLGQIESSKFLASLLKTSKLARESFGKFIK
jgi:phenylalanine ammonia-lyase